MWTTIMNFLQRVPRLEFPVNYYRGPEVPLEDIEHHLIQFTGGSIDLRRRDSGIATLCINHYEKRNAISGKMMVDLSRAVMELEKWEEGKGVLLYGIHHTFCSGGDLEMARKTGSAEDGFKMASYMHDVLRRFQRLPMLTVAVIEGSGAIGGGAELALACDFRLMAAGARGIGLVHSRMGIVPAWGGGGSLVALLGRRRALDVLALARVVPPEEAVAMGLADAVLPGDPQPPEASPCRLQSRTRDSAQQCLRSTRDSSRSSGASAGVVQLLHATAAECGNTPLRTTDGIQRSSGTTRNDFQAPVITRDADGGHRPSSGECRESGAAELNEGDGEPLEAALEWLRDRTRAAPEVLRAAKTMCDNAAGTYENPLDERRLFAPLWGGRLNKEALSQNIRHT